jgi:hypothetical protein
MSAAVAVSETAILDGEGSSTDRRLRTCSSRGAPVRIATRPANGNDASVVAAIFEAQMSREQAEQLAALMSEGRATRPEGVITAALTLDDGVGRLTAYWADRETLDRYFASVPVPRGVGLMRKVGVEPQVRIVEMLELG